MECWQWAPLLHQSRNLGSFTLATPRPHHQHKKTISFLLAANRRPDWPHYTCTPTQEPLWSPLHRKGRELHIHTCTDTQYETRTHHTEVSILVQHTYPLIPIPEQDTSCHRHTPHHTPHTPPHTTHTTTLHTHHTPHHPTHHYITLHIVCVHKST